MSRELPHNRTAEEAVLGAVLLDGRVLGPLIERGITESSFFVPQNAVIWKAMLRLSESGSDIDPVTLESALRATDDWGLAR